MAAYDPDSIAHLREEYCRGSLDVADVAENPFVQFGKWFEEVRAAEIYDGNAMTLSTVAVDGQPSARTLLLKGFTEEGFEFFTNYESRKGQELEGNPRASMLFFWKELERQIGIRGTVEKLPHRESEAYFQSRPRGSQIGAWLSKQSREIPDREWIAKRQAEFEAKYPGDIPIPLPPFWGGYRLVPDVIEFWQGRPSRLHDRIEYIREPLSVGGWERRRLSP